MALISSQLSIFAIKVIPCVCSRRHTIGVRQRSSHKSKIFSKCTSKFYESGLLFVTSQVEKVTHIVNGPNALKYLLLQ